MRNGFLTSLVAKNHRTNLKWRVLSALLAGIALLFALQGFSRADDDDHQATVINDCTTPINQAGRYFLANDLKHCDSGLSIAVSHVQLQLRGHTIQSNAVPPSMISVNGGAAGLSYIEIEGPGTVTGGLAGIEFDNVHRSWVHNVNLVGNADGIDIKASDTTDKTASTNNEFRDNVATGNILNGIQVNGGNYNSFIHNNLSGNFSDGLQFLNAKNNVVRQNTVDANGMNGIDVGVLGSANTAFGNTIDHNTALGNGRSGTVGLFDILDNNNICPANNSWTNNSFNLNSPVCIM
jgi:hypothetical protein